jgi:HlyD family secretion protein
MSQSPLPIPGSRRDVARVSFEHLDTVVRVTTIHAWVYLATLFAVCAAAVVFAVVYQVPTKVTGEGILLIDRDTISQVRARATGRLVALNVKLGEWVAPGDHIGEISQDDLEDAIREAKSKFDDLRREDHELTQFEQNEKRTQESAIERLKQAINHTDETSKRRLEIAQRIADSSDRLRKDQHLGDLDLLTAREKLYKIEDDLSAGRSRLAELELDFVKADNARRRAQLERHLKIGQLEIKLALDGRKLVRTSQIVSGARGQVAQVLSARGELVREGSPVVLLHAPKTMSGADDSGKAYDSVVFVPAGEGKKIEIGHDVEVTPATVKREEHGFIRGQVVAISELPATKLAMEAALEHPELVDAFLKRYAPGVLLRVHVKLDAAEDGPYRPFVRSSPASNAVNPFRWSAASGADQPLKTGTMCQAAIVVQRRPLITLVLPWTKRLVGAD